MSFGERMKYYRKALNLTQQELAQRLNVTNQTISSWEINRTEPNMGTVAKISDILGCGVDDLVGEVHPAHTETKNAREDFVLKRYRIASEDIKIVVEKILSTVDMEGDDASDN